MTRYKLFHLKNEMLGANFMANLIGVFFAQVMSHKIVTSLHLPDEIAATMNRINAIFSPSAFIIVTAVTLIYERPIRRFLNFKFQKTEMSPGLQTKANRRVINEPFVIQTVGLVLTTLDFVYKTVSCIDIGSGGIKLNLSGHTFNFFRPSLCDYQ